ncbi:MAG: sterol desaturase family protein [Deltaproteobacteria bacterium]|nr:sterol desaturase family protein [Deltaproteobacteria bacterium]
MPSYPVVLAVLSGLVLVAEALRPWRRSQPQLRRGLVSDLLHLVFNGHYLGLAIFFVSSKYIIPAIDGPLSTIGLHSWVYLGAAASWPPWAQAVTALVVLDFIQWWIHRLLHAVPWLWTFHKVHHSVVDGEMDWIVSFRFHWFEAVLYKGLQYFPMAFFGFSGEAMMVQAAIGTLVGHLNHSNLDLGHGPWRYLFNSPRMHIWHHDYDIADGRVKNFGIVFSAWDWLFGTAHLPDQPPRAIGFEGVERLPRQFFGRLLWPLVRAR